MIHRNRLDPAKLMKVSQEFKWIVSELERHKMRFEVNHFDSGCKMIDIWNAGKFYCIQLDGEIIGFSDDQQPSFTTMPDHAFTDFEKFKTDFLKLIN